MSVVADAVDIVADIYNNNILMQQQQQKQLQKTAACLITNTFNSIKKKKTYCTKCKNVRNQNAKRLNKNKNKKYHRNLFSTK